MEIKEAIDTLTKALREDKGYYISWQANIAMAFQDEFWGQCVTHRHLALMDKDNLHKISNNAAENFLQMLIKQ